MASVPLHKTPIASSRTSPSLSASCFHDRTTHILAETSLQNSDSPRSVYFAALASTITARLAANASSEVALLKPSGPMAKLPGLPEIYRQPPCRVGSRLADSMTLERHSETSSLSSRSLLASPTTLARISLRYSWTGGSIWVSPVKGGTLGKGPGMGVFFGSWARARSTSPTTDSFDTATGALSSSSSRDRLRVVFCHRIGSLSSLPHSPKTFATLSDSHGLPLPGLRISLISMCPPTFHFSRIPSLKAPMFFAPSSIRRG
mmetsp:Transcript_2095/g.4741  ORF Transcript_2095/g.4741 Transcript_2095/m.4741 type:complete len:261 (+) Transcript_2095:355-1137(+)